MVEKYQQSLTMEFRETLLAAQRNQQQQSSRNQYYKAKFDPPKKEQKQKDKLSANIQKFLAKKDEEERQKKLEAQRKREELLAMRDPKALRKIQKTLKVIKSANKSVLEDAVDRDNTAVTLTGPEQPDQDDYGYESQEAAALYAKMMQKYSKIPDEPKFPTSNSTVKKDLNGTRERVKHALQHEDEPVPHRRRRKTADTTGKDSPTRYEPEVERKSETSKPEKTKIRKSMPPPIDFNQLLKLAEQKKSEPLDVATKKMVAEKEPERPMTKKQRKEYEEELARRQRRQERLESEKGGAKKVSKEERPIEKERKLEQAGIARIPKLSDRDKNMNNVKNNTPKAVDKDRIKREQDRVKHEKERARLEKEKIERERIDNEQIEKLKAEREKIERDIDRLNRDRERLEKSRSKLETSLQSNKSFDKSERNKILPKEHSGKPEIKKNIDLKSQNTYRIDKNFIEKKPAHLTKPGNGKYPNDLQKKNGYKDNELSSKQKLPTVNGHNKLNLAKKSDASNAPSKLQAGPSKAITSTFDFDKHINSIGKNNRQDARKFPADVRRKAQQDDRKKPKRRLDSDSEYDSEMDDFIDDGDENMDYSKHIKEIFGYDKSKYRHMDDDDDPMMESSFARQQREEYISKKIGIMEDLEDMRMEAMEKKKSKKKRRISDDD